MQIKKADNRANYEKDRCQGRKNGNGNADLAGSSQRRDSRSGVRCGSYFPFLLASIFYIIPPSIDSCNLEVCLKVFALHCPFSALSGCGRFYHKKRRWHPSAVLLTGRKKCPEIQGFQDTSIVRLLPSCGWRKNHLASSATGSAR